MRRKSELRFVLAIAVVLAGGAVRAVEPGVVTLSMDDALRLAMQNSDVVRTLNNGQVSLPVATSYDPAIAQQRVQEAMAAFDASVSASMYWSRFEGPPEAFFGPGLDRESRFDQGTLATALTKKWTPGTETRVAYNPSPGYLYYPSPSGSTGFNPSHVAAMELGVRQPLLRGGGPVLNTAPIRVAQLKTDQSAWEFKEALLEFTRSVQEAYWELQAARYAVYVVERQIPLIDEVVRVEQANLAAHRSIVADLAKARSQQRALRQELVDVRMRAQEAELRFRNLLGLDRQDMRPVELITPPPTAPVVVDLSAAVALALDHRPDLIWQRIRTRIDELELLMAENRYLPQLDVQALYRANGLQDDLSAALSMMGRQEYYDWEFGATFSMPLGRNADRSRLRAAQWQLQRDRALLRESVRLAEYQIGEIAVRLSSLQEQYREAGARVQDAQEWARGARIRYENPPPAGRDENWLLLALNDYLLALRASTDASIEAASLLARYNTELARLEEAQGTALATYNIELLNDPCSGAAVDKLPEVKVSAVSVAADPPRDEMLIERLPPVTPAPPRMPAIVRLPPEFGPQVFVRPVQQYGPQWP